jgi:hypothetical protein
MPAVQGMRRGQAWDALIWQWPTAQTIWLPAGDPWAYGDLLRDLWRAGVDFAICEHDVIPPTGAIDALGACPHDWCCHVHQLGHGIVHGTLALARFSSRLLRQWPHLADQVLAGPPRWGKTRCLRPDETNPWPTGQHATWRTNVPWNVCDSHLMRELEGRGVMRHDHYPQPVHLHDYGGAS